MLGDLWQKSKEIKTTTEVYAALEEIGEAVGGVVSGIINFKIWFSYLNLYIQLKI